MQRAIKAENLVEFRDPRSMMVEKRKVVTKGLEGAKRFALVLRNILRN